MLRGRTPAWPGRASPSQAMTQEQETAKASSLPTVWGSARLGTAESEAQAVKRARRVHFSITPSRGPRAHSLRSYPSPQAGPGSTFWRHSQSSTQAMRATQAPSPGRRGERAIPSVTVTEFP